MSQGTALESSKDVPGFDCPTGHVVSGGIRIEFPANFLSDTNGSRVGGVLLRRHSPGTYRRTADRADQRVHR
jgi:hypothetical protein